MRILPAITLLFFWTGMLARPLVAEVHDVGPDDDWFELLSGEGLNPGDEVVLRAGVYRDPRRLSLRHRGTADRPITIRAADGADVVFERPDAKQNTFNLEGVRHLHLRGFEITGGAAGIRIRPRGDDQPVGVVLEALHIHHIGGVAVTCNHPGGDYSQMAFRRNHIHHTAGHGEAFYLGGNHATAIFHDSLVEENYLHDLVGDRVSQGDGIEIKQGSYGNRVVGNVIHDTGYPGIIVYGTAGRERNEIRDNVIWNSREHGIQAAADAVIENNFVADSRGDGIYSRTHQGAVPGNLTIRDNVVLAAGSSAALRIIPAFGDAASGNAASGNAASGNAASGNGAAGDDRPSYSGPIEVIGNVFFASENRPAVRIGWDDAIRFEDNRGTGSIEGTSRSLPPIADDAPIASLPELEGHPAWQHLDRSELRRRFAEPDRSRASR